MLVKNILKNILMMVQNRMIQNQMTQNNLMIKEIKL